MTPLLHDTVLCSAKPPLAVMPVTESGAVPVLLMVNVASRELPTLTVPKDRLPASAITRVGVLEVGLVGVDGESLPPQAAAHRATVRHAKGRRTFTVAPRSTLSQGEGKRPAAARQRENG